MRKIKYYKLSYICVLINLINNVLFVLVGLASKSVPVNTITTIIGAYAMISNIILPLFLVVAGIILGIISLVRKENKVLIGSMAIILNIGYLIIWLYFMYLLVGMV